MNKLHERARLMRLKGFSYNEINRELGIPKATLSSWFTGLKLSLEGQKRIASRIAQGVSKGLVKRNIEQTILAQKRAAEIRISAQKEISILSKKDLFQAGITLYWAEGYKRPKTVLGREVTNHAISFTNSDPVMVKVFISFIVDIMGIDKKRIRLNLRLFKHINEQSAISYWSKITSLPKQNFERISYVISRASLGKRPFNRLPFGTIQVRICDTKQFYRLMGWIDGVKTGLAHLV